MFSSNINEFMWREHNGQSYWDHRYYNRRLYYLCWDPLDNIMLDIARDYPV